MGKYEIVILYGGVAGIACLHLRLIGRIAILIELRVSPAARRRELFCILDHELQVPIRLGSGDKGL